MLVMFCVAFASAQTNNPETPKKGGIVGVVVDKKTGDPVRKVVVIARSAQEAGVGTITDAEGKFALTDLDAGAYTLSIDRTGYVLTRDGERKTVTVKPGETTLDVTVELLKTGAISGRVVDPEGDAVVKASIQVLSVQNVKRARTNGFYAVTDDRGEYRVFNIAPGGYRLSVTYTPGHQDMQVRMQKPATDKTPAAGAYPPVYFPGTADADHASIITVEPGAELTGMDVRVIRAPSVRVAGHVIRPGGGPPPMFTFIALQPRGPGPKIGQDPTALAQGGKGEFEMTNVPPGSYMLTATSAINVDNQLTGHKVLEVGDSDVENIELPLNPPRELSGRLIVPEGRKAPTALMIALGSREPDDPNGVGPAELAHDGTFKLKKVTTGDYELLIASTNADAADDLYVTAIRMGDADALIDGIHVGDSTPEPIEIVLKANGATANCTVKDESGTAVPNAHVVLRPDGPKQKALALYGDCHTDAAGTCKIQGIAPGEYHAYALPSDIETDYRDPDSFKLFEKYAKALKFGEGDRQDVELTPAPIE